MHIVPRKLGDGGGSIHSMFDSSHRLEENEMIKVFKDKGTIRERPLDQTYRLDFFIWETCLASSLNYLM